MFSYISKDSIKNLLATTRFLSISNIPESLLTSDSKTAIFILTHKRPRKQKTLNLLRKIHAHYKNLPPVFLICDNTDPTIDELVSIVKTEKYNTIVHSIIVFDKKLFIDTLKKDVSCFPTPKESVILWARIFNQLIVETHPLFCTLENFIQLDDDYLSLSIIDNIIPFLQTRKTLRKKQEKLYEFIFNTIPKTHVNLVKNGKLPLVFALAQGGDLIGGRQSILYEKTVFKRKAMNWFYLPRSSLIQRENIFATLPERDDAIIFFPFFIGDINEDVNAYTSLQRCGIYIMLTFSRIVFVQTQTQKAQGGMTSTYLLGGTYLKSIVTSLFCPSANKVSLMRSKNPRIHHRISYDHCSPKIVYPKTK